MGGTLLARALLWTRCRVNPPGAGEHDYMPALLPLCDSFRDQTSGQTTC